ncbi:AraC family transcriptional regulator [Fontibacillus phaseoli]|uniref:AraC family transcriptional regulator n=1 Tax=Fontibacillus phaseoli TaxID=1416533 RepID=A0A369BJD8_9BACL|nr:AraC family transcriptional regulator [Fontibacillus phaseoli]RCX21683.1 AraC family transcriptional regulator [Fontibacillus phaseoli]
MEGGGVSVTGYRYWELKRTFALAKDQNEDWIMFALESGSISFAVGSETGEAGGGEAVICPPGVWLKRKVLKPVTFHYVSFRVNGLPSSARIPDFFAENDMFRVLANRCHIRFTDRERFFSNLRMMREADKVAKDQAERWRNYCLGDLCVQSVYQELKKSVVPASADTLMERALSELRSLADAPFEIRQVASRFGMTPVQFIRRFRNATGQTPLEYVTALRISKACLLLEETEETLDAIAEQCGYESGFYLSRVFLKQRGIRPSEYRKTYKV